MMRPVTHLPTTIRSNLDSSIEWNVTFPPEVNEAEIRINSEAFERIHELGGLAMTSVEMYKKDTTISPLPLRHLSLCSDEPDNVTTLNMGSYGTLHVDPSNPRIASAILRLDIDQVRADIPKDVVQEQFESRGIDHTLNWVESLNKSIRSTYAEVLSSDEAKKLRPGILATKKCALLLPRQHFVQISR